MKLRASRTNRFVLVGMAAGATVLATTSLASAHGGDTTKVHGCVVPSSGYLRVVEAGESCKKGETPVDWSIGTEIAAGSITGEGTAVAGATGDIALGTVTGQGNNTDSGPTGNLGLHTVGRANLVDGSVNTAKIEDDTIVSNKIAPGGVHAADIADGAVDANKLSSTFLGQLVTESELAALLSMLQADDTGGAREPNDGDGFVHWNHLEGMPWEFADGDDDDGTSRVNQLKMDLAASDGTPNENSDLVSFDEIKDLRTVAGDGRVTGSFIEDGSITAGDLATGSVRSDEIDNGTITAADLAGSDTGTIVAGAVTSEKIFDGTIVGRDVADASLTTEKIVPNMSAASGGSLTAPADGTQVEQSVGASVAVGGGTHRILVTGLANASCTACLSDNTKLATLEYQVYDGTTPISSVYRLRLSNQSPYAVVPIYVVDPFATAGAHEYKFRVRTLGEPGGAAVTVDNISLSAIDLGRASS